MSRTLRSGLLTLAVISVAAGACSEDKPKRQRGQSCRYSDECVAGLTCFNVCMTSKELLEVYRAEEQHAKRVAALKERELLKQSGVTPPSYAERPPLPSASQRAGGSGQSAGGVRVATTKGRSPIFAACRESERLIGGGCKVETSSSSVRSSYPSHFAEGDTLGARWNCEAETRYVDHVVEAYALCLEVSP